jgi:hypothetical protein
MNPWSDTKLRLAAEELAQAAAATITRIGVLQQTGRRLSDFWASVAISDPHTGQRYILAGFLRSTCGWLQQTGLRLPLPGLMTSVSAPQIEHRYI